MTDLSTKLEQVTGDLEDQNAIRRDWKRRAEAAENAIVGYNTILSWSPDLI